MSRKHIKLIRPRTYGQISYISRILTAQPANLFAYWPMNEATGSTADNAEGTAARDGTYNNVTLANAVGPDGTNMAPFFDGPNAVARLKIPGVATDFPGEEGTINLWFKVYNAGVWTDSTIRYLISFRSTSNDLIYMQKLSSDNQYQFAARDENQSISCSETIWKMLTMSWSTTNDEVIYYEDGIAVGTTDTGLGAWAGSLNTTYAAIGAQTTTGVADFHGWISHVAMWNAPLSAAKIASFYT